MYSAELYKSCSRYKTDDRYTLSWRAHKDRIVGYVAPVANENADNEAHLPKNEWRSVHEFSGPFGVEFVAFGSNW